MFWEMYQTRRIFDAESRSNRAARKADKAHVYIEQLERKLDILSLACQSLWEVVRERTNLTEADLEAKMEEIDIRDGRQDGKLSNTVMACPSCQRKTSGRRANCLYCGASIPVDELFGRR